MQLTLEFTGEAAESFSEITRKAGSGENALRRALCVFDLVQTLQEKGFEIILRHPDGGDHVLRDVWTGEPVFVIGPSDFE
jgi:hypothetical protein